MIIKKTNFKSYTTIGIFCSISENIALLPLDASAKFEGIIKDVFGVEVIKTSLGETNLLGSLSKIYGKKAIVSNITTDKEIKYLEDLGLKTLRLNAYHAVGNLISVNKNAALLSKIISDADNKKISKFYSLDFDSFNVAGTDLVGSVLATTDEAFAVSSSVSEKDFEKIKNLFKVDGNVATVNYGDGFVSNGLLVNTKGLIVGEKTTGYEIMRLDEIFRK
ncbi:MAG: translation initiation factor IF-6 [Candidatus ainarchaeum sp.]|nr:translation initiation factor IF-6 [Candidatus ainarchaeum sp.]